MHLYRCHIILWYNEYWTRVQNIMQCSESRFNISLWNIEPPYKTLNLGFKILWPWNIEPPSDFPFTLKRGFKILWQRNMEPSFYFPFVFKILWTQNIEPSPSDFNSIGKRFKILWPWNIKPPSDFNWRGRSKYYDHHILNPPPIFNSSWKGASK